MKNSITRRGFIGGALALGGLGTGCMTGRLLSGKRWYKGNLHMHTLWSDGRAFPEEAVLWYKSHGYDFIGISDHNVFQSDAGRWLDNASIEKRLGKNGKNRIADYLKKFPDAETRPVQGGNGQIRLKTFNELAKAFEVPGGFLMIPNVEATRSDMYGDLRVHQLHMNYVNVPEVLASYSPKKEKPKDKTLADLLRDTAVEAEELARKHGRKHIVILNHPIWTWYDVGPEALIDDPQVRFFELCNNGSPFAPGEGLPADGFDTDRFWDVVNAFRARRSLPLLYGIGTDDTHYYFGEHGKMLMPGNAWSLVRADSLCADDIIDSMLAGDFVTCEMLEPEDVSFDRQAGRLDVSVAAKTATARTIRFIVTKKDFSEKPVRTLVVRPAEKKDTARFERTINIYDDKIGQVAKTVKGQVGEALRASYTMQDDDLYVRARIEESGQPLCTAYLHPQGKHVAWTQPYVR